MLRVSGDSLCEDGAGSEVLHGRGYALSAVSSMSSRGKRQEQREGRRIT